MAADTVFAKILRGDLPATFLHQDDRCVHGEPDATHGIHTYRLNRDRQLGSCVTLTATCACQPTVRPAETSINY